jgi:flagellar biogenesis protein FliO
MKSLIPAQILILLIALFGVSPVCSAQQPNAQDAANQTSNITKETDHLPFMKDERAPADAQEPGTGSLLVKTIGAMLLIVGLIFFGAWGLKKFGFGNLKSNDAPDAPDLTVLSTVSLGSGRTISTIQFGERVLLVGSTAQTFTLLADEAGERVAVNNPRSVADLLDEENASFTEEFNLAQSRLDFPADDGGRI